MAVLGSPGAGSVVGTAVGLATPAATWVHGPAHPVPMARSQAPPTGVISTAWPGPRSIEVPGTENPEPVVTITELPLFSVSATRTLVASWAGDRPASEVPP